MRKMYIGPEWAQTVILIENDYLVVLEDFYRATDLIGRYDKGEISLPDLVKEAGREVKLVASVKDVTIKWEE